MRKGVVVEVHDRHAIVLTDSGAFIRVRGGSMAVGEEIALPASRRRLPRRGVYAWTSAAAAMLLFAFFVFAMVPGGGTPVAAKPVAYVSIDINPSVELGVDSEGYVLEAGALNLDGEELLEGLELVGLPLERAVGTVMDAAETKLLSGREEADIVITSVVLDEMAPVEEAVLQKKVQDEVDRVIQEHHADEREAYRVTVWSAPKEVLEEASAAGLSAGKMTFLLKARASGVDVSAEELQRESIHDVAKRYEDKKPLDPDPAFTKETIAEILRQIHPRENASLEDGDADRGEDRGNSDRQDDRPGNGPADGASDGSGFGWWSGWRNAGGARNAGFGDRDNSGNHGKGENRSIGGWDGWPNGSAGNGGVNGRGNERKEDKAEDKAKEKDTRGNGKNGSTSGSTGIGIWNGWPNGGGGNVPAFGTVPVNGGALGGDDGRGNERKEDKAEDKAKEREKERETRGNDKDGKAPEAPGIGGGNVPGNRDADVGNGRGNERDIVKEKDKEVQNQAKDKNNDQDKDEKQENRGNDKSGNAVGAPGFGGWNGRPDGGGASNIPAFGNVPGNGGAFGGDRGNEREKEQAEDREKSNRRDKGKNQDKEKDEEKDESEEAKSRGNGQNGKASGTGFGIWNGWPNGGGGNVPAAGNDSGGAGFGGWDGWRGVGDAEREDVRRNEENDLSR